MQSIAHTRCWDEGAGEIDAVEVSDGHTLGDEGEAKGPAPRQ